MKRFISLVALLLLLSACCAAQAAGPGDSTPSSPTTTNKAIVRTGFAGSSETTITGLVVDVAGKPLVDVDVKLYRGGLLAAEQLTSSDGSFEFNELIDYGQDVTIDLWFVPPNEELIMENVILKESSAAKSYGLYSNCVARTRLDPITDIVVKLYDLGSRTEMLKRKGCIE